MVQHSKCARNAIFMPRIERERIASALIVQKQSQTNWKEIKKILPLTRDSDPLSARLFFFLSFYCFTGEWSFLILDIRVMLSIWRGSCMNLEVCDTKIADLKFPLSQYQLFDMFGIRKERFLSFEFSLIFCCARYVLNPWVLRLHEAQLSSTTCLQLRNLSTAFNLQIK